MVWNDILTNWPHRSAVTSVEWNITGTVLSSAGNDGRIRLWKATSGNVWRPAGSIGVEQAEELPDADVDMDERAGESWCGTSTLRSLAALGILDSTRMKSKTRCRVVWLDARWDKFRRRDGGTCGIFELRLEYHSHSHKSGVAVLKQAGRVYSLRYSL